MLIAASDSGSPGQALLGFLVIAVVIALYWLPTIVAVLRHHHNIPQVAIVNGLAGWTFVGWVIAITMAMQQRPAPPVQVFTGALPPHP